MSLQTWVSVTKVPMIVTHVPIIIIIGAHAFFCDIKVISTYLLSLVLHLVATYFYDGPDSNNIISKNVGYDHSCCNPIKPFFLN